MDILNQLTENETKPTILRVIELIFAEPRIDKKMLLTLSLKRIIPSDILQNNQELFFEIENILNDTDKRMKIEMFYTIFENQEERKLLFDKRTNKEDSIYNIKLYPFKELLEIEKEIYHLCGNILNTALNPNQESNLKNLISEL